MSVRCKPTWADIYASEYNTGIKYKMQISPGPEQSLVNMELIKQEWPSFLSHGRKYSSRKGQGLVLYGNFRLNRVSLGMVLKWNMTGVKFIIHFEQITWDTGLNSCSERGCHHSHVILADNQVVFLFNISNAMTGAEGSTKPWAGNYGI